MQHYGFVRLYVYSFLTGVKEQRDAALWVWWNNLENNINSGFILLTFVNSCLNPVFYAFPVKVSVTRKSWAYGKAVPHLANC